MKSWKTLLFTALLLISFSTSGCSAPRELEIENTASSNSSGTAMITATNGLSLTTVVSIVTPVSALQTFIPSRVDENCTYSAYYWQQYPERWLIDNVVIGQLSVSKGEALRILSEEEPNLQREVFRQFLTAILNSYKGASIKSINSSLEQTSEWLATNLNRQVLREVEREEALLLIDTLRAYNMGQTGPGSCSDDPQPPTTTPTKTPTATFTPRPRNIPNPTASLPTPGATVTISASPTASPTQTATMSPPTATQAVTPLPDEPTPTFPPEP